MRSATSVFELLSNNFFGSFNQLVVEIERHETNVLRWDKPWLELVGSGLKAQTKK